MDRLESMSVFAAVADEESFAAAARRLRLSPPAVTRAIAALEERIGARLLHRTTRLVRLTEAGARFLADCRQILGAIEQAEAAAAGAHEEARGQLSVTASLTFGRRHVAPILLEFIEANPLVSVRALFLDRVVDLVDEGLDVAVCIAHLPDSSLSAVRVGSVRIVLCASPAYLATRGRPRRPADLERHQIVALSQSASCEDWTFRVGKRTVRIRPPARLVVNSPDVAIGAAVAGRGITRCLSYMVEPEVAAGQLELLLPESEPPPIPIHLVHAEGRRAAAKVRAFVELATERLRARRGL